VEPNIGRGVQASVTAFGTLWRSFFAQCFSSETVTSDIRLRQGVIWVMAFLVAPGLSIAFRFGTHYQFALHFAPERADGLLLMVMILFVSYSAVAIGLIAVFVWDGLSFGRRDAMVLGVLPIAGSTVAMAKLAALAALLGAAHAVVNTPTALIFAFAVSGNIPGLAIVRQLFVHMLVTGMAGLSIFAALVTARGVLGLVSARLAAAAAAPFQFAFVAAMLCVMVLAVTSARQLALPAEDVGWIPSFWYVGLFEDLVGSPRPVYLSLSGRALWTTVAFTLSALAVTLAAFPLQFQRALAPAAHPGTAGGSARLLRGLAWLAGARRPLARAVSDFLLVTLARNRPVQTVAAINAAIAAPIIVVGLWRAGPSVVPTLEVLWIPMVVVYWLAVGLRASFYVPSELPANWAFAVNAPGSSSQYGAGVRASMLAVLLPAGVLSTAALVPFVGWRVAALHCVLVLMVTVTLAEVVLITIGHLPFTRAYPPGHARLRTRWWIYPAGLLAFAFLPVRGELMVLHGRILWSDLFGWIAIPALVVAAVSIRRARVSLGAIPEDDTDESSVVTLGLDATTRISPASVGPTVS
jgi:hypothetical protein